MLPTTSTQDIVDNDLTCPLLEELPPEVRTIIWRSALGDSIVHVEDQTSCPIFRSSWDQHEFSKRFASIDTIDQHPDFIEFANRTNDWTNKDTSSKNRIRARWHHDMLMHSKNCRTLCKNEFVERYQGTLDEKIRRLRPASALLRTCRIIYLEARDIFWEHNTFAFYIPHSTRPNPTVRQTLPLCNWITNRTSRQKDLITSIHLTHPGLKPLEHAAREALKEMRNLRELHITLCFDVRDFRILLGALRELESEWQWFRCLGIQQSSVTFNIARPWLETVLTNPSEPLDATTDPTIWAAEKIRSYILPPVPVVTVPFTPSDELSS